MQSTGVLVHGIDNFNVGSGLIGYGGGCGGEELQGFVHVYG